ncbi:MAG: DUF4255 domain-containing protein [Dysgonamonadaceae bacterium]|nr:DUF4255 domain-containing protein [Dysgonamonadaceae bacterium]
MIYKILSLLNHLLNDYLRLSFRLTENIAFLCPLKESGNVFPANRISISLVGIERETGGGIHFNNQNIRGNLSRKTAPSWQLNLYVLFSAVFLEKQYEDSLQVLSGVLSFIQKNNTFSVPDSGTPFALEPVNLSFHEQSNLWGICGGNYYPSLLCKLRVLTIDEQEILDLSTIISKPETNSTTHTP